MANHVDAVRQEHRCGGLHSLATISKQASARRDPDHVRQLCSGTIQAFTAYRSIDDDGLVFGGPSQPRLNSSAERSSPQPVATVDTRHAHASSTCPEVEQTCGTARYDECTAAFKKLKSVWDDALELGKTAPPAKCVVHRDKVIGRGGNATVYEATWLADGRDVAVKARILLRACKVCESALHGSLQWRTTPVDYSALQLTQLFLLQSAASHCAMCWLMLASSHARMGWQTSFTPDAVNSGPDAELHFENPRSQLRALRHAAICAYRLHLTQAARTSCTPAALRTFMLMLHAGVRRARLAVLP